MKWLCAAALAIGCGSAAADVLTEANIPKYDITAGCAAAPAARIAADWMERCTRDENAARRRVMGKDVPPLVIVYCDADSRLHDDFYTGGVYWRFEICLEKEHARPAFQRAEALVLASDDICEDGSPNSDANFEKYMRCKEQEFEWHMRVKDQPYLLDRPGADECMATLVARHIVSWQNIIGCGDDTKWWRAGR